MRRVAPIVLAGLLSALAACRSSAPVIPAGGRCQPTVAGRPPASFGDYASAKQAYARQSENEALVATLEDAAWIRYESDAEEAMKKHRAYFDFGYTTFEVTLRSKTFTQPTAETFVLEDSTGARMAGRPVTYQGSMVLEDNRWQSTFSLSFRHTLTADVNWIRLSRQADGAHVEWTFAGDGPPPVSGVASTPPVSSSKPPPTGTSGIPAVAPPPEWNPPPSPRPIPPTAPVPSLPPSPAPPPPPPPTGSTPPPAPVDPGALPPPLIRGRR